MLTAMRPPLTTFEAIEAIAARHPAQLALIDARQYWNYGDLYTELVRLTRRLLALGIARGHRVAVSRPSFHLELMLLIACENLGAATASFSGAAGEDRNAAALFGHVDWVLSEAVQVCPAGVRFQRIDEAFVQSLAGIEAGEAGSCPRAALELHEPQRIVRTSGSTGPCKFMVLSRQAQEYWIHSGGDTAGYRAESRLLLNGPMIINVAFTRASACLRSGGAVAEMAPADIAAVPWTHVWGLPVRIAALLDRLPAGYLCPRKADVGTGGGTLAPETRWRAQQVFGGRVSNRYGGNEVGLICDDLDSSGCGLLSPGVDLRILDAQGRELPQGEAGMIVVRTPAMADGYLGEPDATQAAFRDGWFHTGDWGALIAPRTLRLGGRHDDLLNVGGIKLPAGRLEDDLRAIPGVRDCAALAVHLDAGAVTVGLALQAEPAQEARIAQAAQARLSAHGVGAARLMFVQQLPRLPNGKVDRLALLLAFCAN